MRGGQLQDLWEPGCSYKCEVAGVETIRTGVGWGDHELDSSCLTSQGALITAMVSCSCRWAVSRFVMPDIEESCPRWITKVTHLQTFFSKAEEAFCQTELLRERVAHRGSAFFLGLHPEASGFQGTQLEKHRSNVFMQNRRKGRLEEGK